MKITKLWIVGFVYVVFLTTVVAILSQQPPTPYDMSRADYFVCGIGLGAVWLMVAVDAVPFIKRYWKWFPVKKFFVRGE